MFHPYLIILIPATFLNDKNESSQIDFYFIYTLWNELIKWKKNKLKIATGFVQ